MDANGDRLYVEGIEFYGYHGVSAEERRVGHRFRVDVSLWLDLQPAGATDDLRLTHDYSRVADLIVEAGRGGPYRLLETLAEQMSQRLLHATGCARVRLRVAKLNPPMVVHATVAGVEIERHRPVDAPRS